MAQQAGNTEALHIQRLEKVLEYTSQSPHDKSKRNKSVRIYEREKVYAIDNGKRMKMRSKDEAILEAEAKIRHSSSSSSSCSCSNNQQVQDYWTVKGNTITA
ncbi:MAG: hypothetical protein EZS28_004286 [Streblomastix strix]|uniref:Uncharacterized protein n=1 Tax=Streblomastix strix TaxID=222440 RepID=A0A5J4X0B3_9EUKA|nr:MAG: hypothetical protein EZS28_004286 [Streblomastix strix]